MKKLNSKENSPHSDKRFENFEPQNDSQKVAKNFLEKLAEYLTKNKIPDAVIIWIQGAPWLWKSHLLNSFNNQLRDNKIDSCDNLNDEHFLTLEKYKASDIILIDDLFQNLNSLDKVSTFDINNLSRLIFHIYENKKILIITSNFDINAILDKISSEDKVWRLRDRITELLSHTQPIKLEWESYRKKKALESSTTSAISDIFQQVWWIIEAK